MPTVAEMGCKDFETVQWYGILAPAQTPPEMLQKLQRESRKALQSTTNAASFASESAAIDGGPGAEFTAFTGREQRSWKDNVLRANTKPD